MSKPTVQTNWLKNALCDVFDNWSTLTHLCSVLNKEADKEWGLYRNISLNRNISWRWDERFPLILSPLFCLGKWCLCPFQNAIIYISPLYPAIVEVGWVSFTIIVGLEEVILSWETGIHACHILSSIICFQYKSGNFRLTLYGSVENRPL